MSEITAIQNATARAVSVVPEQVLSKSPAGAVAKSDVNFSALVGSAKTSVKPDATEAVNATDKFSASAKAKEKFEAMVASQLFGTMLKSMPGDSFGSGMAGDIYKSMFADALGEQIAKHGGLGIAGILGDSASRLHK